MISLTTTSQKLEVTTSAATAVDVLVSYVDHTTSGGVLGDQNTLITTATTTDVLAAPAASTQRQVKMINIMNTGASANIITVKKDISATEYDIVTVSLAQNERLQYLDGRGWVAFANSGAVKNSINQGASSITSGLSSTVLGSNVINNNATANTIADVTGLNFPVTNGKTYWFQFHIQYTAAATTTGSRWSISGPTTTRLNYMSEYSLTATTSTRNAQNTAYDLPAAANASSALTTGNRATIEGMITPSADGTVTARFASEIANSAITALAGSVVYYQQLN
jgi:hypothetical protein